MPDGEPRGVPGRLRAPAGRRQAAFWSAGSGSGRRGARLPGRVRCRRPCRNATSVFAWAQTSRPAERECAARLWIAAGARRRGTCGQTGRYQPRTMGARSHRAWPRPPDRREEIRAIPGGVVPNRCASPGAAATAFARVTTAARQPASLVTQTGSPGRPVVRGDESRPLSSTKEHAVSRSVQNGLAGQPDPVRGARHQWLPPRWRSLLLTAHIVVAAGAIGQRSGSHRGAALGGR